MECTVSTEIWISASHQLPNYEGKCSNLHGHNWKVKVWARGEIDQTTGMVIDFTDIKAKINTLDHIHLNDVIPNPTAENIAVYIYNLLKTPDLKVKVRVYESIKSYAEVGDKF